MAHRQSHEDERLKNHPKTVNAQAFEIGRWTAHAVRRSASTPMSQFGISDDVTDACLNHIKQDMSVSAETNLFFFSRSERACSSSSVFFGSTSLTHLLRG
jgi:hypothetical protein